MTVGVFGRGRLSDAAAIALAASGHRVLWRVGKGGAPGAVPDVVLDASSGCAVAEHAEWATMAGVDMVIATTGWDVPGLEPMVSGRIGVLVAPNLSLGAALLSRMAFLLGRYASLDEESDVAIVERHHRAKLDAPSGTAKSLAAAVIGACPRYTSWSLGSVSPNVISVASMRVGTDVGAHEILLSSRLESITVTHEAKSRELYGYGAVAALAWIRGREGVHGFDEMADELLESMLYADRESRSPARKRIAS
ncbi:MAG: hypothetical protein KKA67_09345 [Spirochaetes bacterium]|nr:hypothetical protein [Spirochaetota bacterium]MBU1080964.1 hypothetical protein [Spirochaetota bacterium]